MQFEPTRAAGLAQIEAFRPRMGKRYASGRNYDRGPGKHNAVSCLSPWVRRRLVTEAEVVSAAVAEHGPSSAEKFIQEVVWRGYFKGWLERRPSIWGAYRTGLDWDLAVLDSDRRLAKAVAAAEAGATGIACFDAWVEELVETGYVHNHARMWFASIWIFTLGLPWRIGADFFYRHLLDGDPASNTLGWRWVAGLHTRGKAYHAQAWNIAKFTSGRFDPKAADLAPAEGDLGHLEPDGLPPLASLRTVEAPDAGIPTGLLITEEDCRPEDFDLAALDIRAFATFEASHLRSPRETPDLVTSFERGALADAARRVSLGEPVALAARDPADLVRWAAANGLRQIATPYVPTGPLRDWMRAAEPLLAAEGIALREWRRDWDARIWPHATAGFFKVKKEIPRLLDAMEIA